MTLQVLKKYFVITCLDYILFDNNLSTELALCDLTLYQFVCDSESQGSSTTILKHYRHLPINFLSILLI